MMIDSSFRIVTDLTSDLTTSFVEENNIPLVYLSYSFDGINFISDWQSDEDVKKFYDEMRSGKMPITHLANPLQFAEVYEPILKAGQDILHIAFSSGLSGSFGSAVVAATELREKYPERKINLIDSLSASGGQGLLVMYAIKLQKEGKSLEEVTSWVNENIPRLCHYVIVDDLNHLHRGGRISKASAVVGSLLGIKPIIHMNDDGKLINIGKERGRQKAIERIIAYFEELSIDLNNQLILITHTDAEADALLLKEKLTQKYGLSEFIITPIDPVIGSHTGPGTIALFFLGKHR